MRWNWKTYSGKRWCDSRIILESFAVGHKCDMREKWRKKDSSPSYKHSLFNSVFFTRDVWNKTGFPKEINKKLCDLFQAAARNKVRKKGKRTLLRKVENSENTHQIKGFVIPTALQISSCVFAVAIATKQMGVSVAERCVVLTRLAVLQQLSQRVQSPKSGQSSFQPRSRAKTYGLFYLIEFVWRGTETGTVLNYSDHWSLRMSNEKALTEFSWFWWWKLKDDPVKPTTSKIWLKITLGI